MFARLADDLNTNLACSSWSVSEKSALIFSRTSRDRVVGACCTKQGPQRIVSVDPSINRVSRGGVDPILFVFLLSLLSLSLSLVLQRSCDRRAPAPTHPTSTSG
jgi:hypothetical protein